MQESTIPSLAFSKQKKPRLIVTGRCLFGLSGKDWKTFLSLRRGRLKMLWAGFLAKALTYLPRLPADSAVQGSHFNVQGLGVPLNY
jgi:hypothetical protein